MTLIIFNKGTLSADRCHIDTTTAVHSRFKRKPKLFVSPCERLAFAMTGDALTTFVREHFLKMLIAFVDKHNGVMHEVVAEYETFLKDFKKAGFPEHYICITNHGGFYIGTGECGVVEVEPDDYFSDGSNSAHADVLIPWFEEKDENVDYHQLYSAVNRCDCKVTAEFDIVHMKALQPWNEKTYTVTNIYSTESQGLQP